MKTFLFTISEKSYDDVCDILERYSVDDLDCFLVSSRRYMEDSDCPFLALEYRDCKKFREALMTVCFTLTMELRIVSFEVGKPIQEYLEDVIYRLIKK